MISWIKRRKKRKEMEKKFVFEDINIKDAIKIWSEECGWKYENFLDILTAIGITFPVLCSKLQWFDAMRAAFIITEPYGKKTRVYLEYRDNYDSENGIKLESNGETIKYYIKDTLNSDKKLDICKDSKEICRDGKKLVIRYGNFIVTRMLTLDDVKVFIKISVKTISLKEKVEMMEERVNEYLMEVDKSTEPAEILDKLMLDALRLLSDERRLVDIEVTEETNKKKKVEKKISMKEGIVNLFVNTNKKGEIFEVRRSGNWKYCYNGTELKYSSEEESYAVTIKGTKAEIENVNLQKMAERAMKKILEYQKKLG